LNPTNSNNSFLENKGGSLILAGPVGSSLIRLSIPMILGLISILIINLVDTFYISLIGDKELVAISFTFPVTFIMMSFSFGIGIGASAVISRAIGEGDTLRVRRLTTDSILLIAIIIIAVAGLGYLKLESIFSLMGASAEIFNLIEQYMIPWLIGVVFVVIPIVGNSAIRATGDTKTPSLIMLLAAIVNAILDPVLIFGYGIVPKMGIRGAAVATVISYISIMIVGLWVLGKRERMLALDWPDITEVINSWRDLLYIGLPAILTQLVYPFSNLILTSIAASIGDKTVAAFGVGSRIESIAMIGAMALSSVVIPFIGLNYGAGNFDRIKIVTGFIIRFAIIWGALAWIFLALISNRIAWGFSDDLEIQYLIKQFFLIVPFGFGFYGISQLISASCNAISRPFHATMINLMRLFIFLIPLVYFGSQIWGATGFFFGIAIGNLATGFTAYIWFNRSILPSVLEK